MSKTRAFLLNVLFPLIVVAVIFLFVRTSMAEREIATVQKQMAELREAASSTFEQTIRRFDAVDRRLGELATFSKKKTPAATQTNSDLASAVSPKTHKRVPLPVRNVRRDERKEQEMKLQRDLFLFSKLRSKVCAKGNEGLSKRCEDKTRLLAAQGNSAAQAWLGTEARDKQDTQTAVVWLEQAANQGDCDAMDKLGAIYAGSDPQSSGSVQEAGADSAKALFWYGKSASLGDVSAMGAIARIYQEGRLVDQDQREAILWYEFASKTASKSVGSTNFPGVLGEIYSKGTGADQDKMRAYQWYAIACADATRWDVAGDASCTSRGKAASELGPIEVAKAQALAVEWQKLYRARR